MKSDLCVHFVLFVASLGPFTKKIVHLLPFVVLCPKKLISWCHIG